MPPSDSDLIDALRARAGRHGRLCFRSEIVRAALRSLAALDEVRMIAAVDAVERVEQGKKKMKKKG
jgi:plasmid stability protein